MPKKMKLNLEELNVQSFVTSLDDEKSKHILGGGETDDTCVSCEGTCDNSNGCICTTTCPTDTIAGDGCGGGSFGCSGELGCQVCNFFTFA